MIDGQDNVNWFAVAIRGRYDGKKYIQTVELSDRQYANSITTVQKDSMIGAEMEEKEYRIRKLTEKECWRLMGFQDKDIEAAKAVGISKTQLYKQAGNSIVVDVLYHIYRELYKAMPYLFDDLKVSSYFSGIGAFESGLDRLYADINSGNFT